jgi:hypothetical protein
MCDIKQSRLDFGVCVLYLKSTDFTFSTGIQDGAGDKPADVLFGSFYHGRDLCVDVTIVNPTFYRHTQETSRPSFFLAVGSHPQTSTLCRSM